MPELEQKPKPFRYTRTFQAVTKERSAADMDKEALEDYISGILGIKDPKRNSTETVTK